MSDLHPLLYALALCGVAVSAVRWLRVGQREHYLAGSVTRFAWRWWWLNGMNRLLLLVAIAAAIGAIVSTAIGTPFDATDSAADAAAGTAGSTIGSTTDSTAFIGGLVFVAVVAVLVGPRGLSLRGRTSKLAWTRRLITVAVVAVLAAAVALGINAAFDTSAVAVAVLAVVVPGLVDLTLLVTKPIEQALTRRWVRKARNKLDRIDPVRVAITGSYGKTTVKGYLRHLVAGTKSVVASPASFNNTAGLCRSVNEHLESGTEVFVAEMGTYSRGEIAAMVRWVQPSISILTAVGPVHLERFGSLDKVVAAKTEIFATSRTAIINVDSPLLATEAVRLEASGISVIRCSAAASDGAGDATGDATGTGGAAGAGAAVPSDGAAGGAAADVNVCSADGTISLFGRKLRCEISPAASPTNIACAIAAASVLGVSDEDIAARLATLPDTQHRRQQSVSASGVTVIDDTYNSNPAGAAAALQMLADADVARRVVVSPGMVELGSSQFKENAIFARAVTEGLADDFVIVGLTNRAALLHGCHHSLAMVHQVPNREAAVEWVRANLTAGDGVLYENDLPDHYP